MADRVKYFLLGVLFLVVAGVIAYDRWNPSGEPRDVAERPQTDTGDDFDMSSSRREILTVPGTVPDPQTTAAPSGSTPEPVAAEQAHAAAATAPPAASKPETPKPETKKPEARKPEATKPETPAPSKTHVIRKGETLEAIAIKYYGTREGIEWIVDANRLGNANRIFANQKLVIPAKKEIAKEGGTGGATTTKTKGTVPPRYKVKEGDGNLYAICRKLYGREGLGARVYRVMETNHLHSADIQAGTVLILPPR